MTDNDQDGDQGVQDDGSRTVGDRPDQDDQDDRLEEVPGPVGRNRGDLTVPADPADRLLRARAEYDALVRRLDLLRDPDPVQRQWARDDWDRHVRELRELSPWYGMLAERARRAFMRRQAEYDEFWARQRRLRQDARRPGRREQSF